MTNKLVVIINSLKVPKIKKILLYEMKFLVLNYSCLQNPWLGGYHPQIPFLSVLCPQPNMLNPPCKQNSWVCNWYKSCICDSSSSQITTNKSWICGSVSFQIITYKECINTVHLQYLITHTPEFDLNIPFLVCNIKSTSWLNTDTQINK